MYFYGKLLRIMKVEQISLTFLEKSKNLRSEETVLGECWMSLQKPVAEICVYIEKRPKSQFSILLFAKYEIFEHLHEKHSWTTRDSIPVPLG
jgi:hypothetical protein